MQLLKPVRPQLPLSNNKMCFFLSEDQDWGKALSGHLANIWAVHHSPGLVQNGLSPDVDSSLDNLVGGFGIFSIVFPKNIPPCASLMWSSPRSQRFASGKTKVLQPARLAAIVFSCTFRRSTSTIPIRTLSKTTWQKHLTGRTAAYVHLYIYIY